MQKVMLVYRKVNLNNGIKNIANGKQMNFFLTI